MSGGESRLVSLVRAALESNSGALRLVAAKAEVSYSWVCKVKQGRLKDPGAAQVERVLRAFYGGVFTRTEIEYVMRQHLPQAQATAILDHLERLVPGRARAAASGAQATTTPA